MTRRAQKAAAKGEKADGGKAQADA